MPEGETSRRSCTASCSAPRVADLQPRHGDAAADGDDGRIAGAIGVDTRTAEILVIRAKAVILCMGAAGRLGLPASGYLFGTYENPANSGDGYAMAYHAGADAREPRVLPDQPADQGLQRPGLRLRAGPVRRLHRQQRRASASSSATTGAAR